MLHRHRIGQGLPISTIIIAALGILVLVILGYVFAHKTSEYGKDLGTASKSNCPTGYTLKSVGTSCKETIYGNFGTDQICCKNT